MWRFLLACRAYVVHASPKYLRASIVRHRVAFKLLETRSCLPDTEGHQTFRRLLYNLYESFKFLRTTREVFKMMSS